MSEALTMADINQALNKVRERHRRPVRVLAGAEAWAALSQECFKRWLVPDGASVWGVPLTVLPDKAPRYLAIEMEGGGVVPVAEFNRGEG